LCIIIGESAKTTFETCKVSINIDLNVGNNEILADMESWNISEEDICSCNELKI